MRCVIAFLVFLPFALFASENSDVQDSSAPPLRVQVSDKVEEKRIDIDELEKSRQLLNVASLPRKSSFANADSSSPFLPSRIHEPIDERRVSERSTGTGNFFREDYRPKSHPILSKSKCAKCYVECTTVCCFLSQKWFKTTGFLASVATCGLAGIAYGVSDVTSKNNLCLAILILKIAEAALKKFENFAHSTVHDQEKEHQMFDIK